RCDRVAKGVIEAVKSIDIKAPIVVRLEGTNAKEAGVMLKESGLDFIVADTLEDGARKVVGVLKN
ncbi:MAG: succinate--CoA ligase subunit beta, partial [Calditrichales bacterium]|nr:succinate--CoA ligase subunit beta [Calditrichales bacterium]